MFTASIWKDKKLPLCGLETFIYIFVKRSGQKSTDKKRLVLLCILQIPFKKELVKASEAGMKCLFKWHAWAKYCKSWTWDDDAFPRQTLTTSYACMKICFILKSSTQTWNRTVRFQYRGKMRRFAQNIKEKKFTSVDVIPHLVISSLHAHWRWMPEGLIAVKTLVTLTKVKRELTLAPSPHQHWHFHQKNATYLHLLYHSSACQSKCIIKHSVFWSFVLPQYNKPYIWSTWYHSLILLTKKKSNNNNKKNT